MFDRNSIITSKKFKESCDIVFSEVINIGEFEKIKQINNFAIFDENEENILYQLKKIKLKSDISIFCPTFMVKDLFKILNKYKSLKNITLVSHQGDDLIDKKLFDMKPQCIDKWFSTNVIHRNDKLISIPLGIANFNNKNLNENDFNIFEKNTYFRNKDINLYINFQKNTNNKERDRLYDIFQDQKWLSFEEPVQNLNDYKSMIKNSRFVLAPWGNGVDTHRFWETLYSGSIPITKNNIVYEFAKDLPVLFVNDYSEVNEELLDNFINENKNTEFNYEILKFSFWKDKIPSSNLENDGIKEIVHTNVPKIKKYNLYKKINQYSKIVLFYIKKLKLLK